MKKEELFKNALIEAEELLQDYKSWLCQTGDDSQRKVVTRWLKYFEKEIYLLMREDKKSLKERVILLRNNGMTYKEIMQYTGIKTCSHVDYYLKKGGSFEFPPKKTIAEMKPADTVSFNNGEKVWTVIREE